ncbi:MAG: molybdate ABC transporter substrate-binding protein [Xanthomonadaceae bacterium]|nr:molybdate ABC transporter substrate-binding protein [Xanthomonadaceae bacterium]MDE3072271.1 molybdate ABC transporter substrate-binding protein [Pseudomonadota bacterium]
MRMILRCLMALALLIAPLSAPAGSARHITIAAAADLRFAMDAIVASYRHEHPGDAIDVVYGSSGKLLAQIEQGAPFALFFSADSGYPRQLVADGQAGGRPVPYALGGIVLWSASIDMRKVRVGDLLQPRFGRIAIANPQHAPYGKRAEQALRAAGIWGQLQSRLVYGENIAQTAQFAQSGNARVGIVAQSSMRDPAMAAGSYVEVPAAAYQPLRQSFVLTRRGAGDPLARDFAQYMLGAQARGILVRYGFHLPDAAGG